MAKSDRTLQPSHWIAGTAERVRASTLQAGLPTQTKYSFTLPEKECGFLKRLDDFVVAAAVRVNQTGYRDKTVGRSNANQGDFATLSVLRAS